MVQAREEELIDYPVIRYVSEKDSFVDDHKYTSMECYLDIYLNGKRFTTSFCSPGDHTDLVIGILAQMGQIRTYDDIVRMDIDEETLQATVVTLSLIHLSEPTRLRRLSYAIFCSKNNNM